MKKTVFSVLCALLAVWLCACGSAPNSGGNYTPGSDYSAYDQSGGDEFREITELDFTTTAESPSSAFSLDVNTASYTYIRSQLNAGNLPDANAVRIEEMINYFSYDYPAPESDAVSVSGILFDCPWNEDTKLLRVGVKTAEIEFSDQSNNLVFLIDSSGSMWGDDRLGLFQRAFTLLADQLTENDRVSIVTYAGSSRVVLSGERGDQTLTLVDAVNELTAGGSTAGAQGIQTAYRLAVDNFIEGGNNRVILATDGDFNVGVSSQEGLKELIRSYRDSGVYLTVLGFGSGNYKDTTMETLATCGNGNYGYIDSITEANRLLVESLGGTFVTVARDAKAQVTFNPDAIEKYRLIGYDNKRLTTDEWEDDTTDAGELGSGLCVTALYEVQLAAPAETAETAVTAATAAVRYKDPAKTDDTVAEVSCEVPATVVSASEDDRFLSAVAMFGLILRDSAYKGTADFESLSRLLEELGEQTDPYRKDFAALVAQASTL